MRYFKGLLFDGNEQAKESIKLLHKLLDNAYSISSGLQQGGDLTEEYRIEREDAIRDIAAAVLGLNIEFKEKLPYPW